MRVVRVSRLDFRDFLFPAVTSFPAEDEREMETGVRVVRKITDLEVTDPEEPGPEAKAAMKAGRRWYPAHTLREPDHAFEFEEDEHRLILKRMGEYLKGISPLAAEDYLKFLKNVRDAPEPGGGVA